MLKYFVLPSLFRRVEDIGGLKTCLATRFEPRFVVLDVGGGGILTRPFVVVILYADVSSPVIA